MTANPALLAALVAERFTVSTIESERFGFLNPGEVRIERPQRPAAEPVDTLPAIRQRQLELVADAEESAVVTIHTPAAARRAGRVAEANRRAAALAHLRRPAADVEGRAS